LTITLEKIGNVKKLKCIATNTGGKYYSANNPQELEKILHTVKKVVSKKVTKAPVARNVSTNTYDQYKLPSRCNSSQVMFVRTKKLFKDKLKCVKIIVKSGGAFYR
jgi:hypothetical protein